MTNTLLLLTNDYDGRNNGNRKPNQVTILVDRQEGEAYPVL